MNARHLRPTKLPFPSYQSEGASGLDLYADWEGEGQEMMLRPGQITAFGTNLAVEIPEYFEGQVRGRSGLAFKHQIVCPHSPGTIDSDYIGEIAVLLQNVGEDWYKIVRGDRIAQLVIAPVVRVELFPSEEFKETERGSKGFGSTGEA